MIRLDDSILIRLDSNLIWTWFGLNSDLIWIKLDIFLIHFSFLCFFCLKQNRLPKPHFANASLHAWYGWKSCWRWHFSHTHTLGLSLDQWISEIAIMSSMCSSRRQIMAGNCVAWGDVEAAQNVFSKERMKNYSKLSYARFISHLMRKYLVESVIN